MAVDRYATLRKFAPALIEALEFKAGRGSARTIAAIRILRELNRSGKRDVPPDAPMPFKKEWRKLVICPDGKINRRLYETAILAHLRNKLRSGDVWVERSSAYRRFDSYLLPATAAAPIASALGLPATADEWLKSARQGTRLAAEEVLAASQTEPARGRQPSQLRRLADDGDEYQAGEAAEHDGGYARHEQVKSRPGEVAKRHPQETDDHDTCGKRREIGRDVHHAVWDDGDRKNERLWIEQRRSEHAAGFHDRRRSGCRYVPQPDMERLPAQFLRGQDFELFDKCVSTSSRCCRAVGRSLSRTFSTAGTEPRSFASATMRVHAESDAGNAQVEEAPCAIIA